MENHHCGNNKLNQRAYDSRRFSCNELECSSGQDLKSPMYSSPCVAKDILEVTSNTGGVGFVAVGRRLIPNDHNTLLSDPLHQTSINSASVHNEPLSHKQNGFAYSVKNSNKKLIHHQSEPVLHEINEGISYTNEVTNANTIQYSKNVYSMVNNQSKAKKSNDHSRKSKSHHQERQQRTSTTSDDQDNFMLSTTAPEIELRKNQHAHSSITKSQSIINAYPLCKICGQRHRISENHEYDYKEEVDDDLQCDICLQPFVDPFDTKCGHTFCSICLKNYVRLKKLCPVDRKEMSFTSSDCWQSSLVLRKLVDKLIVHCPNTEYCKLTLPRAELAAHLKERCPGTIDRCAYAIFGCSYKGPRFHEKEHAKNCKYQHFKGDPVDCIYPNCVKHTIELFRPEGIAELGLAIVGGNDTPLRNIIVQGIIPGSLVAEDGRICSGDIIIEVNGEDLHNVNHVEARMVLSRSSRLMHFVVLREKNQLDMKEDVDVNNQSVISRRVAVSLLKPPSDQLGIKITTCDDGSPGIYIMELVPGRVAHANGELKVGDRILEISSVDLRNGTPELAALVIQNAGERVDIVVSREMCENPVTIANPWAKEQTLPRNNVNCNGKIIANTKQPLPITAPAVETFPMNPSYKEKVISLKKSPNESLGIIVAGGMTGVRGDLPVFVQDIQPMGILGKDKRLQRGDLLIQVNGVDLTGLSHSQAIAVLKETAQHCKSVSLTAYELNYAGKEEDFALWEELSGVHHQRCRSGSLKDSNWSSWTPSWKMWLAVPRRCLTPRDVLIRKGSRVGLGFSIVGGHSDKTGHDHPVFVKYVVPNSPASVQGKIRCGDQIIAINGAIASQMTHSTVISTLKRHCITVLLSIVSWPGSVH